MDHRRIALATSTPAAIHHALLVAGVAAAQAGSRTAAIAGRIERHRPVYADAVSALVAVFAARDLGAAPLLGGSFHPRVAGNRPAAQAGMVKPGFTLAF